jgi:hypothetical protein
MTMPAKKRKALLWCALSVLLVLGVLEAVVPGFVLNNRVGRRAKLMHEYTIAMELQKILSLYYEDRHSFPRQEKDFKDFIYIHKLMPHERMGLLSSFRFVTNGNNCGGVLITGSNPDEQGFVLAVTDTGAIIKVPAPMRGAD